MSSPTIAVTMGDPRGIGPEIICKALSYHHVQQRVRFVIIGALSVFEKFPAFKKIITKKNISFLDASEGSRDIPAAILAYRSLQKATQLIQDKDAVGLVTAPISKTEMRRARFKFPGHTEYLCHEFGVKKYAMMLFHKRLRVVLTTIHVPLKQIFSQINSNNIIDKLELTTVCLRENFEIKRPRIAVCGLNPHAGEGGLLGAEEKSIIGPALKRFQRRKSAQGIQITGPVSADTVFHQALKGDYDAVLCHYHDQGLIPLKTTGFDEGVNLTLGLPFVRTSPDHGTAFDIAGRGVANPGSMIAAIEAAKQFIK